MSEQTTVIFFVVILCYMNQKKRTAKLRKDVAGLKVRVREVHEDIKDIQSNAITQPTIAVVQERKKEDHLYPQLEMNMIPPQY